MKQVIEKLSKEDSNKWPSFFSPINTELLLVQNNLINKLSKQSKLLSEIIRYIFESGGKRVRPALSLLFAKATGDLNEKHIILAELTELIHTASLVHDDIIDEASLRRGKETINNLWNDKISVITGDFLFAEASIRLGQLENTEIVKIYAQVLSDLCAGEIDQYAMRFNTEISWDYYIQKSYSKTASLFSAACKSAAILNNQSPEIITKSENYGKYLGIAFQIIDDTLDFTKSTKEAGKKVGSDLKQGIVTAPVIFALESKDERAKQIKSLIESRFNNKSEEDFEKAIRLIFELGGCDRAKELANDYLNKAKESLDFVTDKELKENLFEIANYIASKA
jgi:all-trans-nonaprenyl-diphosphate synthase